MAQMDRLSKAPSFRPGVMQWVIGALLLLAVVIPLIAPLFGGGAAGRPFFATVIAGLTPARIVMLIVMIAGWAYWVWRIPNGGEGLAIPLLANLTAFIAGAIVIALAAGGEDAASLLQRIALSARGYAAIIDGAFLKPGAIYETLIAATPLLLTGLAVAVGFRAGLFNIGAEGQFLMGGVFGVFVGYAFHLPPVIHAMVAMLAGALGGALWGAIPGFLKARLGAHEVINTIMMNYIAIYLYDWLVNGPMMDTSGTSSTIRTPNIDVTARIPRLVELFPDLPTGRLHLGFFIAVLVAIAVWWLIWKTTIGFELRTTGSNPNAARYAGMHAGWNIVLAMALSGALAGLAGTIEVQGVNRNAPSFFQAGYGFDAIAVALLAQNNPLAVIPSALLFGALRTGSEVLQIRTGVSRHIIAIIQALILLFVAAPSMIRLLYRLKIRKSDMEEVPLTRGWGG